MALKLGRNFPCPCGSGRKYKKCCWLKHPAPQDSSSNLLEVIREVVEGTEIFTIKSDPHNPPDVFFDTNVWRGMNQRDVEHLQNLRNQRGFRYRYSITNYVELVSHLEDPPSKQWSDPLGIVRASFRRMNQLCDQAILPSPEMQFLHTAKLDHYLDPVWIPNAEQTTTIVRLIANANSITEVTGKGIEQPALDQVPRWTIDPAHYKTLREVDERSMSFAMAQLPLANRPFTAKFTEKLTYWFLTLASFFLLRRPSRKRIGFDDLTSDERNRFVGAFTQGSGRLFADHCKHIAQMTLLQRKKIDPNDLYDMLQLLLLSDNNRIFVTDEKSFFRYEGTPKDKRIVRWSGFRQGRTTS